MDDWHLLDTAWALLVMKTSTAPVSFPVYPSGCSCLSVWPAAPWTPPWLSAQTQHCTDWWTSRSLCVCRTPSAAPVDKQLWFMYSKRLFGFKKRKLEMIKTYQTNLLAKRKPRYLELPDALLYRLNVRAEVQPPLLLQLFPRLPQPGPNFVQVRV